MNEARPSGQVSLRPGLMIVVFCGVLMMQSAAGNDMLIPGLTHIAAGLPADQVSVQLSIPVYIIALGGGQFVFGPISDRFGRRPVILLGTLIYFLGGVICANAGDIDALLAGRIVQGAGAACGHVAARAILRDLFEGRRLAMTMGQVVAVFSLGPILAPLIGYSLIDLASWRAVFIALAALGGALFLLGALWFKETLVAPNRRAIHPAVWAQSVWTVVRHPQSRFFTLMQSINASAFASTLAMIPVLYETLFGIRGFTLALLLAVGSLGLLAGQALNRRLLAHAGALYAIRRFALIYFGNAALIAVLIWTDSASLGLFVFALFMVMFSYTGLISNGAALVIDPHPRIAGTASSFFGWGNQILSGSGAFVLVQLYEGRASAWSAAFCALSLTVVLGVWFVWRRPEYAAGS